MKAFVTGPPLDPVVQCHPGLTLAREGPLPPRITPPTDPVECTVHSKASKSMFVYLDFNYLKLDTKRVCLCVHYILLQISILACVYVRVRVV